MERNKIINNPHFLKVCRSLGLDCSNFDVFKNMIISSTNNDDVVVLLDEHYNIISIRDKHDKLGSLSVYQLLQMDMEEYNETYLSFIYPFQKLKLSQLFELSKRIEFHDTNNGHSHYITVNSERVINDSDNINVLILSYIKFLGEQVEEYYKNMYQMKKLGFEYPSLCEYLQRVDLNIDVGVAKYANRGEKPYPCDIAKLIGRNLDFSEAYSCEINNVIKLKLIENDLKEMSKFEDLQKISKRLLKILDVPQEEVESRIKKSFETFEIKTIDLDEWLSDKDKQDEGPILVKKTKKQQ